MDELFLYCLHPVVLDLHVWDKIDYGWCKRQVECRLTSLCQSFTVKELVQDKELHYDYWDVLEEDDGVLLLLQDALKGVWIDVDKDESLPLIEELSYSIYSPLAESDVCGNCSDLTYQLYCSCNDEDWGSKKGEKEQEYACLDPSFLVKLGTLIATIHLHDLQESTVWYPNGRKGAKE